MAWGFGQKLNAQADSNPGARKAKDTFGDDAYNRITDPARKTNEGDIMGALGSKGLWDPAGAMPALGKELGWSKDKQKKKMKEAQKLREQENMETRGVLDRMKGVDRDFINKINATSAEAAAQAKDAEMTYSNDIRPRLADIMEDAQMNAESAMTLEEAGDVNNYIHQQVRGLYDIEGEKVRRRGLADTGILQAMGAQATANQMGVGGPMTGSQMQLLSANNQRQASMAYDRAAQEMERLRAQGIDRGFSESAAQYNRGQAAKDRYENSVGNYEGAMDRNIARQRGFRAEGLGYGGMTHGLEQGGNLRDMGFINQVYGGKQEAINQAIAMANAENAGKAGMFTGILGGVGTAVGSYFGGPAGGAAGGAAGQSIGQGGQQMGQSPQGSSYNANQQGRYGDGGYYGGYGQQNPQQPYGRYA